MVTVASCVEAVCGDSHKFKKFGAHRAPLVSLTRHRLPYGAAPTQTGGLNTELTGDSTGLVALAKENPGYGGTGADKLSSVEFAWFCRCLDARRDGEETTPTKPVLKARGQVHHELYTSRQQQLELDRETVRPTRDGKCKLRRLLRGI